MTFAPIPKLASLLAVVSLSSLAGCIVYDDGSPRRYVPDRDTPRMANDGAPASASTSPMLVEVDSDQTMTAVGGDGVGVFIEYERGGHWRVWWTCDTNRTSERCDFMVGISADHVSNVDASGLPSGAVSVTSASRIDALTSTTTQTHGLGFYTEPGAVITIEASVGGLRDGSFLFFVQDGKVNGGFPGKLTNPLMLQGSAP